MLTNLLIFSILLKDGFISAIHRFAPATDSLLNRELITNSSHRFHYFVFKKSRCHHFSKTVTLAFTLSYLSMYYIHVLIATVLFSNSCFRKAYSLRSCILSPAESVLMSMPFIAVPRSLESSAISL